MSGMWVYSGDFLNGEITGQGTKAYMSFGDSTPGSAGTYVGSFDNGERSGYGTWHEPKSGETYEGYWKRNQKVGPLLQI